VPYFPATCGGLVRYAGDGLLYLLLGVLVSAEVEEYGPPLACLPGFEREVYGNPYGVRDLRRGSSLLFSFYLQI
jgi:hypothetical protein